MRIYCILVQCQVPSKDSDIEVELFQYGNLSVNRWTYKKVFINCGNIFAESILFLWSLLQLRINASYLLNAPSWLLKLDRRPELASIRSFTILLFHLKLDAQVVVAVCSAWFVRSPRWVTVTLLFFLTHVQESDTTQSAL